MGWIGFLAVVPWIQALGWAFRPTTVIDVRYLPKQRQHRNRSDDREVDGQGAAGDHTAGNPAGRHAVMMAALLVLTVACFVFWLVFFQFKLIRLTPGWGIIFAFFVVHLMLVFLIGLRFVTPYSVNATVVQRTIQLVPRLPEPTLVDAVLVDEDIPVKKGQPLFQFDRRPYQYKVDQIAAQLAAARQNVNVLKADVDAAAQGCEEGQGGA